MDGAAFHGSADARERDTRRDVALATLGWVVLRFSCQRLIAISAPVLPADTAAAASPSFTAATAFHREDPRPPRSAFAGFASIGMTDDAGRISQIARAEA